MHSLCRHTEQRSDITTNQNQLSHFWHNSQKNATYIVHVRCNLVLVHVQGLFLNKIMIELRSNMRDVEMLDDEGMMALLECIFTIRVSSLAK